MAADMGFETTAEGMEKRLLKPVPRPAPAAVKSRGKTGTFGPPQIKVRGLSVVKKRTGEEALVERSITLPKDRTGGYVNLAVRFDVGSHAIRAQSIPLLDELGRALRRPALVQKVLVINGHTDSDGGEDYNLRLSLNRALAARQYLSNNHAINPARLKVMGYGEGVPLAPNTSAANKQLNRRVEIVATR